MNILAKKSVLSGHIRVPGSKSHTIRALLFSALAEGTSFIRNPLPSADGLSAGRAVRLFGADVDLSEDGVWTVRGAGRNAHLPDDVVDVGNSGSLLYFMSPLAATFPGWTVFTGDESIRTRPVLHVVDALRQLGAEADVSRPGRNAPPLLIRGPIRGGGTVVTDGRLSQYISGIMMAAARLPGTTRIELTDPKEVPFLAMTKQWLESLGVSVEASGGFRQIAVHGPAALPAFDRTVPSDWEAVAFPLVAALASGSSLAVDNVDCSDSQGDRAVVGILQALGADISEDAERAALYVRPSRLSAELLPERTLRANLSGFPDAICALAVAGCFTEGTLVLEDVGVCRKKETDRIDVMGAELKKLGAEVESGADWLAVHGHAPLLADGSPNPAFCLHGGTVESFGDHRVAMSLACLGLGLPEGEAVTVRGAECCSVSFPRFFEAMNGIGAGFADA
ncbi:MAG: 3-phosphoshikimate 1-carboxyvinyltransferase [Treponemataceae bacterium]|nr:3-phosphoshikimate 1-carboxyvinyltransferase [Treponemataceae bacterium]